MHQWRRDTFGCFLPNHPKSGTSLGRFDFEIFPSYDRVDSIYNLDRDNLFSNSSLDTTMDDEDEEPKELFTFLISVPQGDVWM